MNGIGILIMAAILGVIAGAPHVYDWWKRRKAKVNQ